MLGALALVAEDDGSRNVLNAEPKGLLFMLRLGAQPGLTILPTTADQRVLGRASEISFSVAM